MTAPGTAQRTRTVESDSVNANRTREWSSLFSDKRPEISHSDEIQTASIADVTLNRICVSSLRHVSSGPGC